MSPEVQTTEALHGLQQAVLQAAVPQQQCGQVCAVCLSVDPQTSTQALQSPSGGAVGIGAAEGEMRRGLGGIDGIWSLAVPHRRRRGATQEEKKGKERLMSRQIFNN